MQEDGNIPPTEEKIGCAQRRGPPGENKGAHRPTTGRRWNTTQQGALRIPKGRGWMVKPENKIGCDSPGGQQAQCHYNDSKGAFLCCVARPCVLLPQARALAPRTCSVSGQPILISLDGLDCPLSSILALFGASSNPSTSAPDCATRRLSFGSKSARIVRRESPTFSTFPPL